MSGRFSVDLSGKTALVTRCDGLLGPALALGLAKAGAAVTVNGLNPARVDDTVDAIQDIGGRALGWTGDISNRMQVSAMIEATRDTFGSLDVVVNVADVEKRATLRTLDEYDWRRGLDLNLTSAFFFTQLAARVMADEGGGVIVNVGSTAGHADSHVGSPVFASSHAGLIGLTREAARDLASAGIRVNTLCPGRLTANREPADAGSDSLARAGTPDDVVPVLLFLCSDAAAFVTGQALIVDGGTYML